MKDWLGTPLRFLRLIKSFWGWVHLMAELGPDAKDGLFVRAQAFLQERDAWDQLMRAIQFDAQGCDAVLEGLARRHGAVGPGPLPADEALLDQLDPLIWFFHSQKERFPERTVGHGCALGVLHTLFRAAQPGSTRAEVLAAVREEIEAQMVDACRWRGPTQGVAEVEPS